MTIPLKEFQEFSKNILDNHQSLQELSSLKNWDDKFRHLMIAGKKFPKHIEALENEVFLIRGCESKAWLTTTISDHQVLFLAISESKIIRGLLTILLAEINNKTREYILHFQAEELFESLGLERHLSESRKGGFHTLWKEIKTQVALL